MWEVYAYHNCEQLAGVFNSIAMLMGAGSYTAAFAAVVAIGFIAALIAYMCAPEKLQGWKWLASVVLIFTIVIVPRVTVGIVDKTGSSPVRVVDNVPYGLAVLGGLTSQIGNTLTELFETAFQIIPGAGALPSELLYQQHGMMFGSRLLQVTRTLALPDPDVRMDLLNFVSNCTAYDIADGSIPAAMFVGTRDLWSALANTNPARFTALHTAAGVVARPCDEAYASINTRMPAQVDQMARLLGRQMHPSLPDAAAQAAIVSQVSQAYIRSGIADAAQSAADLIRQNALINAVHDSAQLGCQKMGDPSCTMMAAGRATSTASQNAAWINGAKISEQALPIVRNSAEALIYAVFPVVVLMLMVSSGRTTLQVLTGYLVAAVSIQLWPPLFAVLNYMASIAAQYDQAASAALGPGFASLSLATADAIYGNAISAQAVVSYLIIGIPMLAYALARGMNSFGVAMVGGMAGFQSIVGNHSSTAALGNSSLGNVSMDQMTITPRMSNPYVSQRQGITGDWHTYDGTGREAIDYLRNTGFAAMTATAKVSASDVEQASKTTRSAATEMVASQSQYGANLAFAYRRMVDYAQRTNDRHGTDSRLSGEDAVALAQANDEVKRLAKEAGVSESQAAKFAFGASLSVGPRALGVGTGGDIDKNYMSALSDTDRRLLEKSSTETFRLAEQAAKVVSKNDAIYSEISGGPSQARSMAAGLTDARLRVSSSQRAFEAAKGHEQQLRDARERGVELNAALLADPRNTEHLQRLQRAVAHYGSGNPAMVAARLASELGNIQHRPANLRDGSAASWSDREIEREFRAGASRLPGRGSIDGQHRQHVSAVNDRMPAPAAEHDRDLPVVPGAEDLEAKEQGLRRDAEQARAKGEATYQAWLERHDLEERDGRLVIHKSQVLGTLSAAGEDGKGVARDVQEGLARIKESEEAATQAQATMEAARQRQGEPSR